MASVAFDCDRRLSRASREWIRRRIVPLVLSPNKTVEDQIVHPSTCILHPNRDMLLSQEEQSYAIPAGSSRMTMTTTPSVALLPKQQQYWWQCGLCGKTFLTRYYLDLHLETKHTASANAMQEDSRGDAVCPATDICPILGGGCELMALELEPYYGRGGSGGGGGDSPSQRRHYWARMAHSSSCNDTFLQTHVQPACRQVMENCFSSSVAKELSVGVCDTFTCHNRLLHHLAEHAVVVQHVYMWNDEWDTHYNHTVGWTGLVVILSLLIYYGCCGGVVWQRPRKPTTRLLNKKPTSSSSSTLLSKGRMVRPASKVKRH